MRKLRKYREMRQNEKQEKQTMIKREKTVHKRKRTSF